MTKAKPIHNGFNPFSAGRGIKSRRADTNGQRLLVSILFLLEGASNHFNYGEIHYANTVSILFLLEGASNPAKPPPLDAHEDSFNPYSAGRGIKSDCKILT